MVTTDIFLEKGLLPLIATFVGAVLASQHTLLRQKPIGVENASGNKNSNPPSRKSDRALTCDNSTQDVSLDNKHKASAPDKASPSKLADKFGPPKR